MDLLTLLVLAVAALYLLPPLVLTILAYVARSSPRNLVVLITGCDSGFGKLAAHHFASRGSRVIAGCLHQSSIAGLAGPNLTPILLDVTNQAHVDACAARVTQEFGHVDVLINNAGVLSGSFVDWNDLRDFHFNLDVNFHGAIRMTKAFLPLLRRAAAIPGRKTTPRLINVASVAGRTPSPGFSAYCASKHAAEAFSDACRVEFKPFGISVAIIEPGLMRTAILEGGSNAQGFHGAAQKAWDRLGSDVKALYGPGYITKVLKSLDIAPRLAEDPMQVIYAMEKAATAYYPKHRYVVGLTGYLLLLGGSLPSWLYDLLNPIPAPEALRKKSGK